MIHRWLRVMVVIASQINFSERKLYNNPKLLHRIFFVLQIIFFEIVLAFFALPFYVFVDHCHFPDFFNAEGNAYIHYKKRKFVTLVAAPVLLFLVCSYAFFAPSSKAINYVEWDGGGDTASCGAGAENDWSCAANWANDTAPTSDDTALFGATSTKNAVINAYTSVKGIQIDSGYTGTISQSAEFVVGADNFVQDDGTFTVGTSTIDINGSFTQTNGVFTASAATSSVSGDFTATGGTFNNNGGGILFDGTVLETHIDLNTSLTLNTVEFNKTADGEIYVESGDTLIVTSTLIMTAGGFWQGTFEAQGPIIHQSTWGQRAGGGGVLKVTGVARTIELATDGVLQSFTLDSAGTTVNVNGTGTSTFWILNILNGTLNANSGNMNIRQFFLNGASAVYNGGSGNDYIVLNIIVQNSASVSFAGGLFHTGGSVTIQSGTVDATGVSSAELVTMGATAKFFMQGGTYLAGSGPISIATTYDQTGGTFTGSSGSLSIDNNFLQSSGTFTAPSATTSINWDFKPTGGTFTHNNGTILLTGSTSTTWIDVNTSLTLNNLTINKSNNNQTIAFVDGISDTLVIAGTLDFEVGRLNGAQIFEAQGVLITSSSWNGFSGTVHITGPARTIDLAPDITFASLILNSTSTIVNMTGTGTSTFYKITINNGTVNTNSSSVNIQVHLSADGATSVYNGGLGNDNITQSLLLSNGGSVSSGGGAFTVGYNTDLQTTSILNLANASSASFTGTANIVSATFQTYPGTTFTAPSTTLYFTVVSTTLGGTFNHNTSTVVFNGANQHLSGAQTFYNFTKTASTTDTFTLPAGVTTTIAGTMTLVGTINNLLLIRSSASGTQAMINPLGTRTVQFLDVRDNYNASSSIQTANLGVVDSGNNAGWSGMITYTPYFVTAVVSTSTFGSTSTDVIFSEGATTTVYVHGTIQDVLGCGRLDTNTLGGVFYRSGVTSSSLCSANFNNCYTTSTSGVSCSLSGCSTGDEFTANYQCSFPLAFYADPTDTGTYASQNWVGQVSVNDTSSRTGSASSTAEIDSLLALSILQSTVGYGSLAVGATSTEDSILGIQNTGNVPMDLNISASSMVCSGVGTIPLGYERVSSTPGLAYTNMTSITSSSTLLRINLAKQTSGLASTSSLYFKLVASAANGALAGVCTSTGSIVATIHTD